MRQASAGPAFVTQRLGEFPSAAARTILRAIDVSLVLVREDSAAALARRLAALPPHAEVVRREPTAALVRLADPPPVPSPLVVPLARAGRTLVASGATEALPALGDDDPATRWRVQAGAEAVPSLVIDLGAVRTVAGVRCVADPGDLAGVYLAEVATSLDGAAWTPSDARFDPDALDVLFARPADVRHWDARLAPCPARFIRLTNPALAFWGGTWSLAEIDVLTVDS